MLYIRVHTYIDVQAKMQLANNQKICKTKGKVLLHFYRMAQNARKVRKQNILSQLNNLTIPTHFLFV